MKFLSRFFIAAVCFFCASSNLFAQFVIDVPLKEYREKIGLFTIGDLSVGQTAWVGSSGFCSIDGKIFLNKDTQTEEKKYDYVISAKILMGPENSVSVTLYAAKDNKETMVEYLKRFSTRLLQPCPTVIYGNNAFFPVKSINGATTISDLMTKELE